MTPELADQPVGPAGGGAHADFIHRRTLLFLFPPPLPAPSPLPIPRNSRELVTVSGT